MRKECVLCELNCKEESTMGCIDESGSIDQISIDQNVINQIFFTGSIDNKMDFDQVLAHHNVI